VIVPVDGSERAWRAARVGSALAHQCAAELELLQIVDTDADTESAQIAVSGRAATIDLHDIDPIVRVLPVETSVAATIAAHAASALGSIIVLSTSGRGRVEALVGSVAEELLIEMFGPLIVVGPHASVDQRDLRGRLLVPVDGSDNAETVLGLAAAWGIGLEARPWIVAVIPPDGDRPSGLLDSTYPAGVARRLARQSHHPVDFEVLHDEHPGRAIGRFAGDIGASLIVASTHGRAGLARFAIGSRAMSIVRHAPCPVVLSRPPHLRRVDEHALTAQPLKPVPTAPTAPAWRTPAVPFSAPLERSSSMVVAAVADLAARLGVNAASIEIADARAVTWPDNSCGCPEPGMMYVQRPVEGALVVLSYQGRRYEYHGGNPLRLCDHPHPPVGG
jgi:nucleotide-binding universal stress UspA family protein